MPLLLEGKVDDRDETILRLRTQLRESETARLTEQGRANSIEAGVRELRGALNPLYRALRQVFGEIEAMGVTEASGGNAAPQSPRASAAWEPWKQRLGGHPAKAIDALLNSPTPLTQTQLRILIGCANGSIAGIVCTLNKAGLINKNGGKISLKGL